MISMRAAVADTVDFYRADAARRLSPERRAALGQYMTPASVGRFMASLFDELSGDVRVLDPGAGVGSLSAALVERCQHRGSVPKSLSLTCYEIDPMLTGYLKTTLEELERRCRAARIRVATDIRERDFVVAMAGRPLEEDLGGRATFTHVLMNPPYRKISSKSEHRVALRRSGVEATNLYAGFMHLAAQRLDPGGEMVAIVPRSFCNGPYFKPFRERFFARMRLRHIHVFERRDSAFREDGVLQENIIIHAVKDGKTPSVKITTSRGGKFEFDAVSRECVGEDMTQRIVDHARVIGRRDPGAFVYIAGDGIEQGFADRMARLTGSLGDLDLNVSTGPVIDFRVREYLRQEPERGTAPLLYPAHFAAGGLQWPRKIKKPNAIAVGAATRKWLLPNEGCYVVTRRFTAKEEKRRIVASVYDSSLPGELVGFENHLNVLHAGRTGFSRTLATGLAVYLNSSLVDRYFRLFSGHTQVNATDLRALPYPDREKLEHIGERAAGAELSQTEIDDLMEEEFAEMKKGINPIKAQRKVDEALEIVKALGMPPGQRNARSALTLLALLDLRPEGAWSDLLRPLMGITPIMDFCREHYGREYAPNTRETFRRQTMHQFVKAGIALYNPDNPDRPVNSPKACYQISEEALDVLKAYGTDAWRSQLNLFLAAQPPLAAKWARHREMRKIPVQMAGGESIMLSPGEHSDLIRRTVEEFAPRFAPAAKVVYVGDTGDKTSHFKKRYLEKLGVTVDRHGKMPDVVLHSGKMGLLLLIECVTSHGPVDAKRRTELEELFSAAIPERTYITVFPDRSIMARYLRDISWETEVWCADAPDHMIHFNGKRFLRAAE